MIKYCKVRDAAIPRASTNRPLIDPLIINPLPGQELLRRLTYLMTLIVPFLCLIVAAIVLWRRFVGPTDLVLLLVFYLSNAIGVSVGYHRLLTHRSFRTYPAIRYTLAVLGSMAVEGPPTEWVATHRKHHAFADRPGDPHSPHEFGPGLRGALAGLVHAHASWYLCPIPTEDRQHYAPDMLTDRGMRVIDNNQAAIILSGLALPFALGYLLGGSFLHALSALVWGGLIRIFLIHHVVRSIDSICHFFGERRFATHDKSRNVSWLSVLSLGESYHNNHHAFPASAFVAMRRRDFDLAGLLIAGLERLGLVWHVVRVTPEQRQRFGAPDMPEPELYAE